MKDYKLYNYQKYLKQIASIKKNESKFRFDEVDHVLNYLDPNYPKNKKDYVKKLENLFCNIFSVKYAIACNSGTSGLHAALYSLNLKKDDEVIVPGLTVVMDAYAAIHLNAKPVFADVDEETYLITAENIIKKITSKTRAIIVVSLQGLPVDIDPILSLAKKKKNICNRRQRARYARSL